MLTNLIKLNIPAMLLLFHVYGRDIFEDNNRRTTITYGYCWFDSNPPPLYKLSSINMTTNFRNILFNQRAIVLTIIGICLIRQDNKTFDGAYVSIYIFATSKVS